MQSSTESIRRLRRLRANETGDGSLFQAGTVPETEKKFDREVKDAMNLLKKKLNSERGASLTWALLIFLVCTVVGSAVLVAGTAAAGRMSKLAVNDQRYYAVTSTAGFMRDVLGQEITVTRTIGVDAGSGDTTYTIAYGSTDDVIVQELVQALMQWPDEAETTSDSSVFWDKDSIDLPQPIKDIAVVMEPTQVLADAVAEITSFTIDPNDGSIVLVVEKDGFSLEMDFNLVSSKQIASGVKTDTFKWALTEVRKLKG